MQEIALLLSSLAGIATAAAVRARTGHHQLLTLGASSQIQNQIKTLKIEKEILAKTITRLYQAQEWEKMPREHKEGLLARYQRQLGTLMARLEKLEDAKKHPDLGPVGDGLVTLMDQKLSSLDTKMYNIASTVADIKAVQELALSKPKEEEKAAEVAEGVKAGRDAEAVAVAATTATLVSPATTVPAAAQDAKAASPIPDTPMVTPYSTGSFEITTLTNLPTKRPRFPLDDAPEPEEKTSATVEKEKEAVASSLKPQPRPPKSIVIKPELQNIRRQVRATPKPTQRESSRQIRPIQRPVRQQQTEAAKPDSEQVRPKPVESSVQKQPQQTEAAKPDSEQVRPKPVESSVQKQPQQHPPLPDVTKLQPTHIGKSYEDEEDEEEEDEEEEEEIRGIMKDIQKTLEKLDRAESE